MTTIQNYLESMGYLDKAYYYYEYFYVMNGHTQPQSEAYCMGDFDGNAHIDGADLAAFVEDFSNPECI